LWNLPNVAEIHLRGSYTKYGGNAFGTEYDVIYFEINITLANQADIQTSCFQNESLERYFQYIRTLIKICN
jgi:hypothetical protein